MIVSLCFLGLAWLIGDCKLTRWEGIASHAAAAEAEARRAKAAREDEKTLAHREHQETVGQSAAEPVQAAAPEVQEERAECLI